MSSLPGGGLVAVRSVGGLIPADLLARVVAADDLPGLSADDYELELGVTPREAANRAWTVLRGAWLGYRAALERLPADDRATSLTRDKWLRVLLRELGFGELVPQTKAWELEGRSFPLSHLSGTVPLHLMGRGVPLDRRTPGLVGAAERPPHALVQELLNRSDAHLWAIVANDSTLRLLRDSSTLVGQSYVEFNLEAIFDGELFSDFVVLYLLAHRTRFTPRDEALGAASCWLERWREDAIVTGARALGSLRDGVLAALNDLGTGFVRHPDNRALRARLDNGELAVADLHRSLLRLAYRLLFTFVAEDRDLLCDPQAPEVARERYRSWFGTARLRQIALRRRGTSHSDLWQALRLVLDGLGRDGGRPELALPGLGGLFETTALDLVDELALDNRSLLAAIRRLSVVRPPGGGPQRTVDYRHLGAEELGGIYESLLEYVPRYEPASRTFTLEQLAGNDRKTSGSYYTPASLIDCLLDSTLDPLLDEAERAADPDASLLSITVCDPACGSGHFLVAAARRIAHRQARVRAGGLEPTPEQAQAAMHAVVGRCIYGVDLNPLAAELAKVSLWLEALQPGRALSLLDGHIKTGNALLGATPELLASGLPDGAFAPLVGDERKVVTALKRQNRDEGRQVLGDTLWQEVASVGNPAAFAAAIAAAEVLPATSLAEVHFARTRLREAENAPDLRRARLLADAWCAAFVLPKRAGQTALTTAVLKRWQTLAADALELEPLVETVRATAAEYRFFHWHLEFPTIFGARGGGFTCVVGNPPWERVKLQEQEFFATREPRIAAAANAAARKRLIQGLADRERESGQAGLYSEFVAAKRRAEGESHLLRASGRYPLCGRGDINTYAVFAEHGRAIVAASGRFGVIVPTGIATDATTQHYFRDLVSSRALVSLYDFENVAPLFVGVHRSFKFCLLTLTGPERPVAEADFAFFAHDPLELVDPEKRFTLTADEINLLNPNTGTCPIFRTRRDAEITLGIYRRVPVLVREGDPDGNPWGVSFRTMFHMSNDSHLFRTREELEGEGWILSGNVFERGDERMLPLYEAKMIHHYDHRWATYEAGAFRDVTEAEKQDPNFVAMPRYWVSASDVDSKLADRWNLDYFIGLRDICRSTDERTLIAALIPRVAVGHTLSILLSEDSRNRLLPFILSSFLVDFIARLKMGGTHMSFFLVNQLPVPTPERTESVAPWVRGKSSISSWILERAERLVFDASEPDTGGSRRASTTDERMQVRAEIDAGIFHFYGLERDEVDYVLGTFPIVNRKDAVRYGEERTRRLILENYDAMARAIETGEPFVSTLDPPPGEGPRHPVTEEALR